MSNTINKFAKNHNLVVAAVTVEKMNKVIFASSFVPTLRGSDIVKEDGVVYRIDTVANTSVEITPKTIADEAKAAIVGNTGKNQSSVGAAVHFGLVKKIKFDVNTGDATSGSDMSVKDFAKTLGLKITAATVAVQNDVIFQTQGVNQIAGLDIHDGQYFKLDTVANTATLINAEAIAEQAQADLIKGKDTDITRFAQNYNLITSLTLEVKKAAVDAPATDA